MERLQKILSQAGVASRRASERLMLEGRVTVNGTTVLELGTKADAARDAATLDPPALVAIGPAVRLRRELDWLTRLGQKSG